jgi:protein-S-isoprenylcysteine O-methyltransferase Ste14
VKLADLIHAIVTGPARRRAILTPVAFVLFCAACVALVLGGLWLDARLGARPLVPVGAGVAVGLPLLALGVAMCSWCIAVFLSARGTPVPLSPPRDLVARGPYMHTRNPMLTGFFASLLGAGFLLRSASLVLAVTPLVIAGAVAELKIVEEPELERRFGASYAEYKRRVPMFVPRLTRRGRGGTMACGPDEVGGIGGKRTCS